MTDSHKARINSRGPVSSSAARGAALVARREVGRVPLSEPRVTRERRPVYGTAHIPALRPESRSPTAVPLMTREQTPALRRSLGEASHRGLLLGEDREAHHLKRVALRAGGLGAVNDVGDELGVVVKWHV